MRARRPALVGSILLATGLLAGCYAGGGSPVGRDAQLRSSPTPELMTLYQRQVDVDNSLAIMADENWRMFVQDLGRIFYTDRPSRLTREPVPR